MDVFSLLLLFFEVIGVVRMGHDTFIAVTGHSPGWFTPITTALLIDGVMAASLFYVAYRKDTAVTTRINQRKVFLSALAWVMYALQLYIGWSVGGVLGVLVRVTMGAVLLYHTSEFSVWRVRAWARNRKQDTRSAGQVALAVRERAWRVGFRVGAVLLWPATVILGVIAQVLALVFVDMLWRTIQRITDPDTEIRAGLEVHTPTGTRRIEARSTRSPNPYNATYRDETDWIAACVLCGDITGPHADEYTANKAFASHTTGTAHKDAVRAQQPDTIYLNERND